MMPYGKKTTRGGKATKMSTNTGAAKRTAKKNAVIMNRQAKEAGTKLLGKVNMKDMGGGLKSGYASVKDTVLPGFKVKKASTSQGRKANKKASKM